MRRIIDEKRDVDAIFFSTGILALGGLHECSRRRWKVPDRIAVAGFGHDEVTDAANPSLTTIDVPRSKIGRLAAEMLLDRVTGAATKPSVVDVGFEIVARASA